MFTNNWFQITAKANFEKYVPLSDTGGEPRNFLEIGCYEGQASCWLLSRDLNAELTVIDTFKGSKEHDAQFEATLLARFTENVEPFEDRVTIFEATSRTVLKNDAFVHNSFDFIYIDGSHQASDVLEDAVLAFPLLKEGGIMIFDDYTWGQGMIHYDIPVTGIDAFLHVYGNQLKVLEKNTQVIIKKHNVSKLGRTQ